jgi:nucleoside-diphosphate-sugar epimerase
MQSILITGVSGFVGANLALKLIEMGFFVVGVDMKDPPMMLLEVLKQKLYLHVKIDLTDDHLVLGMFDQIECPELVVHLAGVTRVRDAALAPSIAININIRATCSVYMRYQNKSHLSNKKGAFLFISTNELTSLNNPMITPSVYSVTKQCAEEILKALFKPELINTAILRLCTVYGGDMEIRTKVPRIFFEKIADDEEIVITASQKLNPSFIFVDDAIKMICEIGSELIQSNAGLVGGSLVTYNASGEYVSLDLLLKYAEKITEREVKYTYESVSTDKNSQYLVKNNINYEYKNMRPKQLTPLYDGLVKLWHIVKSQKF